MTFRRRLYVTLQPTEKGGGVLERMFEFVLIVTIALNILIILVESIPGVYDEYQVLFDRFEIFSIIFFTVEYFARIYSIVEKKGYHHPVRGRLKYLKSPIAIIDLLSFLPFYLTFFTVDLRFLRIIRLMALFRMFKVARYLHALEIFKRVLYDRREQLVLTIIFIFFILVIISSLMFYVENPYQPEVFNSIPSTMWWGIATLTTVGYGDMVPVTALGKILSGVFAIVGFGLLALPAGILSSGFFEIMHKPESRKHTCPHCKKEFDE
ncbi:MAG TPA: ion transporter [Cyclobacteriaceae bacterium]